MSNAAQLVPSRRLRLSRRLVAVALGVVLATATLTVVLVASGGSGATAPRHAAQAVSERAYFGGPAEGRNVHGRPLLAPANDGSQRFGARP